MKETKVYVDELPKSCVGCKYFAEHRQQCNLELCLQWNEVKFKFNDCPLIDIKTHNRELVKKVCEKIKEQLGFIVDGQERISCDGSATGDKTILAVLDQIQKEFEDGK